MAASTRLLGWLSGGLLLFCWLMVIRSFGSLPTTIPIHFDAAGKPDNWAPKAGIWVLPVLASALYGLFSLLYRYADRLPQKAGAGDRQANLGLLRAFFLQLRFAIVLVMALGIFYSLQAALGKASAEPGAMVPFITLVLLAPTLLLLFRMLRTRLAWQD
ncbi:MAG: DUF1648 domain-containing protein [Chitinophagaceae bacterium]|nr:MAG: DUF1648 domain-containing protein [Chitinophagaceae bacterium]